MACRLAPSTVHLLTFSLKQCIVKQIIIKFGFCDIWNNQGLGKYQPQPSASADSTYLDLDYSNNTKPPQ